MDNIIPQFYRNYGQYVNRNRSFPLDIDGLKPVERRVLLSTYQIAKDKFAKSAKIDGHVIGHFHPHGTCYGTLVQLVRQGFVEGQGNFGCNLGVDPSPPAAMRYTEAKLVKHTLALAFKLINYVPWEEVELDKEPLFLPTMFPFCLLGREYTQGIGFGYKTYIPCYSARDLYDRLLWKLGKKKKKPTIQPISDCTILSSERDLETLLTTGKATIEVQGVTRVEPSRNRIVVKSWPPGRRFESILNKISSDLDSQDVGFQDLSSEQNGTMIVFEVLKQRNKETIFKRFSANLKEALKGTIPFEINVVEAESQGVSLKSVDAMLLDTFRVYRETNGTMLDSEQNRLQAVVDEYNVLEKIRPSISKYLKEYADALSVDDIIELVAKESKEDLRIIKEIFSKYQIKKLFTVKLDTSELLKKIKEFKDYRENLEAYTLNQYEVV